MKKNKEIIIFFTGLIIGFSIGAIIFIPINPFFNNSTINQIKRLIFSIEQNYYNNISADSLLKNIAVYITEELDPYSYYIKKKEFQEYENKISGKYYGYGFAYFKANDSIYIGKVFRNSTAFRYGLEFGDRILQINQENVNGKDYYILKDKLKSYDSIKITVAKCNNKIKTYTLSPDTVKLSSVFGKIYQDSIGYIKIINFLQGTSIEAISYIKNFKKHKINKLVIDLRDNSGGLLKETVKLLDAFFGKDTLLCSIENKNKKIIKYYTTNYILANNFKLIILVNQSTASAAELFAGVIQDYDKGIIIGSQTFGKGVVQNNIKLKNGDFIHLTTKKIFLPSGRWIQKNISEIDTPKVYKTINQRTVYSNSGIVPDVFQKNYKNLFDFLIKDPPLSQKIDTLCLFYKENPEKMVQYIASYYNNSGGYSTAKYWLNFFGMEEEQIYLLPYDSVFQKSLIYFSSEKYNSILHLK